MSVPKSHRRINSNGLFCNFALAQAGDNAMFPTMANIGMLTRGNQCSHPYHDEHLYVDLRRELVAVDGTVVKLSQKEYCLLLLLVQHAGEVVARVTIEKQVWAHVLGANGRTVDMHIGRLRKKLGIYGKRIEVVAFGYCFQPASPPTGTGTVLLQ
jgi:DNA-binding response OmpR family regulator